MNFVRLSSSPNEIINLALVSHVAVFGSGKDLRLVLTLGGQKHELKGDEAQLASMLLVKACPHLAAVPGVAPKSTPARSIKVSGY